MTISTLLGFTFGPPALAMVMALLAVLIGPDAEKSIRPTASLLLMASGMMALVGSGLVGFGPWRYGLVGGGATSAAAGVVLVLSGLVVFATRDPRAALLICISTFGLLFAIHVREPVSWFLALETVAVCGYALVAIERTAEATESALKYFVLSAIATVLFIASLAFLDGVEFSAAGAVVGDARSVVGVVLLALGLSVRVGAAPFHMWSPDVYQHASPESAAYLAGPVKLGVFFVLATACVPDPASRESLAAVVAVLATLSLASVAVGSLTSLAQRRYRRLLGYAGVAQVGVALLALASGNGAAAVLLMVVYAVATVGTMLYGAGGTSSSDDGCDDGLVPVTGTRPEAVFGVLLMASLAGIPPLGGFWGKFAVFKAALESIDGPLSGLLLATVVVAMVGAVVSMVYYGRLIAGFATRSRSGGRLDPVSLASTLVMGAVTLAIVEIGAIAFVKGSDWLLALFG